MEVWVGALGRYGPLGQLWRVLATFVAGGATFVANSHLRVAVFVAAVFNNSTMTWGALSGILYLPQREGRSALILVCGPPGEDM